MKKLVSLVLAVGAVFILASCGSSKDDSKKESLVDLKTTEIPVKEDGTFVIEGTMANAGTIITVAGNAMPIVADSDGNFTHTIQMGDVVDSADLVAKYMNDEQTIKLKFDTAKYEKALQASSSEPASEVSTEPSTSQSSDSLPKITEEQMPNFIDYLKTDLTDKNVDISTYTFYNHDNMLYIDVPNEYKYYEKADLQEFADGMQAKEHEAFNVWAAMNNVDYSQYPMLFIKTADGEALASQKLNGSMELKVK
ncbi:hypothetical protein ACWOE3_05205 [Enterococcus dispar]|uniref:Uncharacterized protein n=1 Tax=Enterococcus dispar ATCC 51266 TaxID=1139219 RepID=S1P120_9ENTE|nr:hypothetical protein [Enterococcus dispar]EOT39008.1 hypothetical protein OMK_02490 [Enterococcus dispar ATCC 51266]EOW86091.1 hypothetical protein I569_01414 [Enterococcus dispar ATCC 51266]OJG39091.1 hypothetical protein RV01_GL001613 [Enterococcus dispar]